MNYFSLKKLNLAVLSLVVAGPVLADKSFNRISTYPVYTNHGASAKAPKKAVAEIVSATKDGMTLVYTDSKQGALGFLDITSPSQPKGLGVVALSGEPTSVSVGTHFAYAGVNTSKSYTNPTGHVALVDLKTKQITASCDVKGQPDSVALSSDGKFLAIAIENERDEELNDGEIPQKPAGHVAVFDVNADGSLKNCDAVSIVNVTGLAEIAPSDPEPEFVSINDDNIAAVTIQENNHIVLIDLKTCKIINHFTAGKVSLDKVDNSKDKSIHLDGAIKDVPREPDAIAWIDSDNFATADEGDYNGGSRTATIFNKDGKVVFSTGNQLEHLATRLGHFPEKRAHKKGTEPEGVISADYGNEKFMFVGMERAGLLAVYRQKGTSWELTQGLPTGWRPEGILAIPQRNLLVVANEKDKKKIGQRSTITLYEYANKPASYPMLESANAKNGAPIGWGALSGMSADVSDSNIVYAVNDGFYKTSDIFKIDVSKSPAKIINTIRITKDGKKAKKLDIEGIAQAKGAFWSSNTFWLVSEGRVEDKKEDKDARDNVLLHVDASGEIKAEYTLPSELEANKTNYGFEGVAVDGNNVVVAVQSTWKDDAENHTKLAIFNSEKKTWEFVSYPLDKASGKKSWVGLSDITSIGNEQFMVLERDNQAGDKAEVKRIYKIDLSTVNAKSYGEKLDVVKKELVTDLLPTLNELHTWTPAKIEGMAKTKDGRLFIVSDNDAANDSSGETIFMKIKQ
jgi:hypothetical protein